MIKLQCFLCIEWIWADHPKNLSHTFLFIFSFLKVASAAFMCLNINWTNNVPNQTFCSFFHIPLFPCFLLSSLCNGAFECSHIDQEKDIIPEVQISEVLQPHISAGDKLGCKECFLYLEFVVEQQLQSQFELQSVQTSAGSVCGCSNSTYTVFKSFVAFSASFNYWTQYVIQ